MNAKVICTVTKTNCINAKAICADAKLICKDTKLNCLHFKLKSEYKKLFWMFFQTLLKDFWERWINLAGKVIMFEPIL